MGPSDCPAESRTRIATLQKRRRAFRYVRLAMCFNFSRKFYYPSAKNKIPDSLQAAVSKHPGSRGFQASITTATTSTFNYQGFFSQWQEPRSIPAVSSRYIPILSYDIINEYETPHCSFIRPYVGLTCQSLLPCCIFRAYDWETMIDTIFYYIFYMLPERPSAEIIAK